MGISISHVWGFQEASFKKLRRCLSISGCPGFFLGTITRKLGGDPFISRRVSLAISTQVGPENRRSTQKQKKTHISVDPPSRRARQSHPHFLSGLQIGTGTVCTKLPRWTRHPVGHASPRKWHQVPKIGTWWVTRQKRHDGHSYKKSNLTCPGSFCPQNP